MIMVQNIQVGDNWKGVTVEYKGEGTMAKVTVECSYVPLAIELLRHALVAMQSSQEKSCCVD